MSGTIPSGPLRATPEVTDAGRNHRIQGIYQIVNSNRGNEQQTLVTPGTNRWIPPPTG